MLDCAQVHRVIVVECHSKGDAMHDMERVKKICEAKGYSNLKFDKENYVFYAETTVKPPNEHNYDEKYG